ncbi:FAD dependent oxidoreductase-domain-containing protein [Pholiota molesta]|nr:FAD dependent oxidoreductase-domain-containing protein [Pholiota molesta]
MVSARVIQHPLRPISPYSILLWLVYCIPAVLSTTPSLAATTEPTPCVANTILTTSDKPLSTIQNSPSRLREHISSSSADLFDSEESGAMAILQKVQADLRQTRVSLPVDNPTKSFWLDTPGANPLADAGSTGELTQDADVCVIGSGITGVSAAWHLSNLLHDEFRPEDKAKVVILEAREFCSGATGRNGGHLVRNVFSSFLSRQALHNTSEAIKTYLLEDYTAKALVNFIKENNLDDTVDLVEGGHITLFRTEEEDNSAKKDYEAAKAAGLGSDSDGGMGVRWITNEELIKKYGLSSKLNYTGVYYGSHNLWPCKLVTELFEDTQSTSKNVNVVLHTKTPVTRIVPINKFDAPREQTPLSSSNTQSRQRRWMLGTPRGGVRCSYVIHATNGYAGHLLPFMAETNPLQTCSKSSYLGDATNLHSLPLLPLEPSGLTLSKPPVVIPHPPPHPIPSNVHIIVPTRGQVGAVRASVNASELRWLNAWDGGGGGWEYWFPRFQDTAAGKNPLIILGGERQFSGGRLEAGVTDDSVVNPLVSKALRGFLPRIFPSQFDTLDGDEEKVEDSWEMEWTGIMGFTKTGDPFVGPIGPLVEDVPPLEEYHNEGQYIAAGFSGHGMPRAYACAEAVAGMIKAKIIGEEWTIPKWLPESYLTWAKED